MFRRPIFSFVLVFQFLTLVGIKAQDLSKTFFVQGHPQQAITFGLEIEVDPKHSPVLQFYRPESVDEATWIAMDIYQKRATFQRIQDNERKTFQRYLEMPYAMRPTDYQSKSYLDFVRPLMALSTNPPSFPATLYPEHSGALEFHGFVFSNLQQMQHFLKLFDEIIGKGDMQGHVVFPFNDYRGLYGYIQFEHDRAFLKRLENQFATFDKSEAEDMDCPKALPAGVILSKHLRPLNHSLKQSILSMLQSFKNHHQTLTTLDSDEERSQHFDRFVSHTRASRYFGPLLRTDGYPKGLMGLEFREWDNPFEVEETPFNGQSDELIQTMKMAATTLQEQGNFRAFEPFESQQITPVAHELSPYYREKYGTDLFVLRFKEFDQDEDPTIRQRASALKHVRVMKLWEHQVYDNDQFLFTSLFFPLQDFAHLPYIDGMSAIDQKALQNKIAKATLSYLEDLEAVIIKLDPENSLHQYRNAYKDRSRTIDDETEYEKAEFERLRLEKEQYAKKFLGEMRLPLAKWAAQVQLSSLYDNYFSKKVFQQ
jgi:hypothetical protein